MLSCFTASDIQLSWWGDQWRAAAVLGKRNWFWYWIHGLRLGRWAGPHQTTSRRGACHLSTTGKSTFRAIFGHQVLKFRFLFRMSAPYLLRFSLSYFSSYFCIYIYIYIQINTSILNHQQYWNTRQAEGRGLQFLGCSYGRTKDKVNPYRPQINLHGLT